MKLNKIFEPDGLLASHFPNYELREGQVKMSELVESCISDNRSAVIEGATGVGKSFAYLIPLILSGQRAIISTSNKSLQDQLSNKDLPALKKILSKDIDWTVLKGKNNYFCHEHFNINQSELKTYLQKQDMTANEANLKLKEILAWAKETKDGDIEYYPEHLPIPVKEMITCDTKTIHEKESVYYELCFANKARQRAREAQIVLVNHTLLALDVALKKKTEGVAKILPDVDTIIIDEAHTFERYAVMAFSDEISFYSLLHLINWYLVKESVSQKHLSKLSKAFSTILTRFLPEKGDTGYYKQEKVVRFKGFNEIIDMIYHLIDKVNSNKKVKANDEMATKAREIVIEAESLINRLILLSQKDDNMLKWSEARDGAFDKPIVRLKSVPIDISTFLKKGLFGNKVVICTSATLAVGTSFDFFRRQIGMPDDALEMIVDSPFNFKKNALIYITMGENEKYWEMEQLLKFSKGRAFVLFTSYRDMQDCYEKVDVPYPKLIQSKGISRAMLLKEFKETPDAVLFATKSFWEGIDVRGDKLLQVIIHKLPFENPSDLVYASKIEKVEKELGKGKHWNNYTIPLTCLKLKQGVGRLIRSTTDIGVIALLDARINYRNYGKAVVDSLPPAHRTQKLERVKRFYERNKR